MDLPKLYCEGNWDSESLKNYTSLEHIKKQLYRGNWSYLSRHPEVSNPLYLFLQSFRSLLSF